MKFCQLDCGVNSEYKSAGFVEMSKTAATKDPIFFGAETFDRGIQDTSFFRMISLDRIYHD